ncbi:MAG TPA: hypothetical protein VG651_13450 [Stellaceae bacterium]|nr:hypothetical protein [Stellaceae bacterium]
MPDTIGGLANLLISQGLSNSAVLAEVLRRFPDANTTLRCISWYRSRQKNGASARPGPHQPAPGWPDWTLPSNDELLRLAKLTAPYIRLLHPNIVQAVIDDNCRHRADWSRRLAARGLDPSLYLWEGSACAFPGVRRHAGQREIAQFKLKTGIGRLPTDALALDDNEYPRQIWSFALRGRKYDRTGPNGFALAHLADHKEYKDRGSEEFALDEPGARWRSLFGLFTCATNTVYIPEGLIRPTDFAFPLRNLLQRRAAELYGDFSNLLPPGISIRPAPGPAWSLKAFDWCAPVGSPAHIPAFLAFRAAKLDQLLSGEANA